MMNYSSIQAVNCLRIVLRNMWKQDGFWVLLKFNDILIDCEYS